MHPGGQDDLLVEDSRGRMSRSDPESAGVLGSASRTVRGGLIDDGGRFPLTRRRTVLTSLHRPFDE